MKKIVFIALLMAGTVYSFGKAIYYPVFITDIEVYHDDNLDRQESIYGQPNFYLDMYQEGCKISLTTEGDIDERIKTSVKSRQLANLSGIAAIASVTANVSNAVNAIKSNTPLRYSEYLAKSYFFTAETYENLAFMAYFREVMTDALIIPVTASVSNNSSKILRGNLIVKPGETQSLQNTNYCDEWRFSDNDDNVYCVRMCAFIVRDKGVISRQEKVAFTEPTKKEKKLHKNQMKRVDLTDYSITWVEKNDPEYLRIKDEYSWDDGYGAMKN